jgi:hypothetical protein
MPSSYYKIEPCNASVTLADFSEKLHRSGLLDDFSFGLITNPVYIFRDDFLDHIVADGLSSLYHFDIAMEGIMSPTMSVDDIKRVVLKFVSTLVGASHLSVIDPYFYAKSSKISTPAIFSDLISEISTTLEKITFVTNGRRNETKVDIHAAVSLLNNRTKISDYVTDEFHDRFWIDPARNIGLVMGTSLNGLGNKIALVDKLAPDDVNEIVRLAKEQGIDV